MNTLLQDLRFTFRQLRRSPAFTCTVLLTMTLAIGATAALTGVLRSTLWNRLPYPEADRLLDISDRNLRGFHSNGLVSVARTADLAALEHDGHKVFEAVAFFFTSNDTLAQDGHEPQAVAGAGVSDDFFTVIGDAPLLGRTLATADNVPNGPGLVVLSHRLWQSSFGGDKAVVGRSVRLGNSQAEIVGVMGPRFDLPRGADLWYPGHILPANFGSYRGDGSRFVSVLARRNVHEPQANLKSSVDTLAARLAAKYPSSDAAWGFSVSTVRASLFGEFRHALLLLAAAVALVLLVAAVNIAGLQLARNAARQQEFAIRGALGISSGRLLRQLATESVALTLAGSALGIAAAWGLLHLLLSRLPAALLTLDKPRLDAQTLLLAVLLSLVIGIFTSALPFVRLAASLREGFGSVGDGCSAAGGQSGRVTQRLGSGFCIVQIALALVLLTLTTAVIQGLRELLRAPLGFDTAQVQTFTVDLPWGSGEADRIKFHQFYARIEAAAAALPGAQGVGAMSALPLSNFSVRSTFDIEGQAATPNHDAVVAEGRFMTPGLLRTLHIPLLAGRALDAHDAETNAPAVTMVSRELALHYFGGEGNALGKRLVSRFGVDGKVLGTTEIVGVVGDVHGTGGSLTNAVQPVIYTPENGGWPHMQFAVRSTAPAAQLEPAIRRLVRSAGGAASASHFGTLSTAVNRSTEQPRLNATLLSLFAAFAMLLVMVGVYGLAAFDLAQRTREFALRMALGSSRQGIFVLLMRGSLRILAFGVVAGTAVSVAASRLLAASVAGMPSSLTAVLPLSAFVLCLLVLAATLLPAQRASTLEPMRAMRTE